MAADYRALGLHDAAAVLEGAGNTDEVLAQALTGAPAVLPVAGPSGGAGANGWTLATPPLGAAGPLPPLAASFADADAPLPLFAAAARGLGAAAFGSESGFDLRRVPAADSEALVTHLLARVAAFTGGAEKSDDLTLMVLTRTA